MMRQLRLTAPLTALLLIAGCERSPTSHHTIVVDGNETRLDVRGAPPESAANATKAVRQVLLKQRNQSHAWKSSELSRINAALATGKAASISKENLHLLEISKKLYVASDAYYDPGIGSLVRLWGFYTDNFPIRSATPDNSQISDWLAHKPALLEIMIDKNEVSSVNPNLQLDFSTILEGVSAANIRQIASAHHIDDALVTMGSDQFSIGQKDSKPWPVMLKDPFGGDLGQVDLQGNEALFSSGNFNKFHVAPTGSRWGHILNPRTGKPSQGSAAVVVLNVDPVLADAASSALMAGGPGNFRNLVVRMKLACAMMVTEENELLITEQMKKRVVFFRDPVPLGAAIANGDSCR